MRIRALWVITLSVLIGVTTACGSGGGSSSDAGKTQPTGTPIVIGNIGSYTGAQASSKAGAGIFIQGWVKYVNDHGGLNGHPVKLIYKDLGDNIAGGLAAAKELIEKERVVAIVGEQDDGDVSWAKYVNDAGVPVIGGLTVNLPFVQYPMFFPGGANLFAMHYGAQKLAQQFGDKFAVLYCAESPQCGGLATLHDNLGKSTGLQVVLKAKVAGASPNYTALCQQLKESGAQTYTVGAAAAVVVRVAKECKAAGLTAKLIAVNGSVVQAFNSEPALNGFRGPIEDAPFFDKSTPAMKKFHEILDSYASGAKSTLGTTVVSQYVAGIMLEKAVSLIPSGTEVTSDSIKTALYQFKGETLGGAAPPLTFTPNKPTLVNCYFVVGQEDQKFMLPQGLQTSCAPDDVIAPIVAAVTNQAS